jgi:hypothetical protein
MARIIVMPDATHLQEGIKGKILYAEQVTPAHLDDLRSSEEILERLEGAVRRGGSFMSMLFTARRVGRLRKSPPDHEVVTACDGS